MAANTADGALLLAKKFGGIVLILLGILGIAVGLEYRSTGLSIGLTAAGIVALTSRPSREQRMFERAG